MQFIHFNTFFFLIFRQQEVFVNKKGNNRSYRCSHCPKQSPRLREIIRHLKVNICGKAFKVIVKLISYQIVWSFICIIVVYNQHHFFVQCDFCPIKFSQHSAYLTHLALHATAKKYSCEVCQETFSNPVELKIHSKSVFSLLIVKSCFENFLKLKNIL